MAKRDESDSLAELLATIEQDLERWQVETLADVRKHAPLFSPFDFLRTDELGLSEILRWMLDTSESHAQGGLFLARLLQAFGIFEGARTNFAKAQCECPTGLVIQKHGRMDVLVEFDGYAIAIENKPRAGWQEKQLERYLTWLEANHPDRHHLIVIKGDSGDVPEDQLSADRRSELVDAQRLTDTDYPALLAWIADCADRSEAPVVREFLGSFAKYVEREFLGLEVNAMDGKIADSIVVGHRLAALRLIHARPAVLERAGLQLSRQIHEVLRMPRAQLDPNVGFKGLSTLHKDSGIDVELEPAWPFFFRLGFQQKDFGQPYWGLAAKSGAGFESPFPELARRLKTVRPSYRTSGGWIVWEWLEHCEMPFEAKDPVAVWEAMFSGTLADAVAARVQASLEELSNLAGSPDTWSKLLSIDY